MRATTLFNRLLELPGASARDVRVGERDIEVVVARRGRWLRCPCGYRTRAGYDQSQRRWRHLDFGADRFWLVATIRRIFCPDCGVRTEDVPWARPRARHTRDFEDVVAWLAQRTDKTTVATLMRCAWETVAGIVGRVVAEHLDQTRLDQLYRLGVDEIGYKRGHQYLTIVGNHDTGGVVWVGEGSSRDTLTGFYDSLGSSRLGKSRRAKIRAVSMDGSLAYIGATNSRLLNARICLDPFHVIGWANQALDAVFAAATSLRERTSWTAAEYRRARWTLRHGHENVPADRHSLLTATLRYDRQIGRAWRLKERLRDLYRVVDPANARAHLKRWITTARRSRIRPFVLLADRLDAYFHETIAAVELGISNGLQEGINAKIRLIKARGYGYKNLHALADMIYLTLGGIHIALPTQR